MKKGATMYQRIEGRNWRHIWIAGDIHGGWQQLISALRARKFNPYKDLLISVGDLIDRGPQSLECLALLRRAWFRAVRGNHEQMAIDGLTSGDISLWLMNGGQWYTRLPDDKKQVAREAIMACDQLPYIIEVNCGETTHIIAHADYPSPEYAWQKSVDKQAILWHRGRLNGHFSGKSAVIKGADHFWFGHTPLKHRYDAENQHYIDTGAVMGGELTLVKIQ
ncbi:protein-serine/threonine phosphatase [Enterobacter sp.]|uniref:protein-serine/threonine phosphatase n=1 Tax=Enterobacter sp. TaxID=42895 RepID=UPI002981F1F5|nr:protein-serine/threonine phosphatase [Enterobacter sp.]